eukprot:SAG31_NODE_1713_length_7466_cov_4.386182_3_plen_129_part_00
MPAAADEDQQPADEVPADEAPADDPPEEAAGADASAAETETPAEASPAETEETAAPLSESQLKKQAMEEAKKKRAERFGMEYKPPEPTKAVRSQRAVVLRPHKSRLMCNPRAPQEKKKAKQAEFAKRK